MVLQTETRHTHNRTKPEQAIEDITPEQIKTIRTALKKARETARK
jgi:hypothetical protein